MFFKTQDSQFKNTQNHLFQNQKEVQPQTETGSFFLDTFRNLFRYQEKKPTPIHAKTITTSPSSTIPKVAAGLTATGVIGIGAKVLFDALAVPKIPAPIDPIVPPLAQPSNMIGIIAGVAFFSLAIAFAAYYKYNRSQNPSNQKEKNPHQPQEQTTLTTSEETKPSDLVKQQGQSDQQGSPSPSRNDSSQGITQLTLASAILSLRKVNQQNNPQQNPPKEKPTPSPIQVQNSQQPVVNNNSLSTRITKVSPSLEKTSLSDSDKEAPKQTVVGDDLSSSNISDGQEPSFPSNNDSSRGITNQTLFLAKSNLRKAKTPDHEEKNQFEMGSNHSQEKDPEPAKPIVVNTDMLANDSPEIPADTLEQIKQKKEAAECLNSIKNVCNEIYETEVSFFKQIEIMLKIKKHFTDKNIAILVESLPEDKQQEFKQLFIDLLHGGNLEKIKDFSNQLINKLAPYQATIDQPEDHNVLQHANAFFQLETNDFFIAFLNHVQTISSLSSYGNEIEKIWEKETKQLLSPYRDIDKKMFTAAFISVHQHFTRYKLHVERLYSEISKSQNTLQIDIGLMDKFSEQKNRLIQEISELNEIITRADAEIIERAKKTCGLVNDVQSGGKLIFKEKAVLVKKLSRNKIGISSNGKSDPQAIAICKENLKKGIQKANSPSERELKENLQKALEWLDKAPIKEKKEKKKVSKKSSTSKLLKDKG